MGPNQKSRHASVRNLSAGLADRPSPYKRRVERLSTQGYPILRQFFSVTAKPLSTILFTILAPVFTLLLLSFHSTVGEVIPVMFHFVSFRFFRLRTETKPDNAGRPIRNHHKSEMADMRQDLSCSTLSGLSGNCGPQDLCSVFLRDESAMPPNQARAPTHVQLSGFNNRPWPHKSPPRLNYILQLI